MRYLGRKYARIFGYGRNLIQEANNEFIGTVDVQGQISERIFAPNGGYCACFPIFRNTHNLENWGI